MKKDITILIVDDIEVNRLILSGIFEDAYNVIEADDGDTALEILKGGASVDLILLDVVMPRMNGIELLGYIKQDARFKDIPVVVNTQSGERENELRALDSGADDFIIKPYNPKIVRRRIDNLIEKYIYQRNAMKDSLEDAQNRIDDLIDTVPGGIGTFETGDGEENNIRLTYFNDALCRLTGYTAHDLKLLTNIFEIIYENDRETFIRLVRKAQNDSIIKSKIRLKRKSGEHIWTGVTVKKIRKDSSKWIYTAVFMDLTDEKEAEDIAKKTLVELRYRAEHDNLTALFNREAFYIAIDKLFKTNPNHEYVIGYWNIDKFKVVNELFGRKKGDEILCDAARWFKDNIRKNGICARFEADHFVTCTTKEYLDEMSDEINRFLAGEVKWNTLNYPIVLHVGFYYVEDMEVPVNLMCDRANMALELIKNNYMTRWSYYNDSLKENIMAEQELITEMKDALKEHQFYVCYQPIVDARTKKTISAEALVRWKHPKRGIISPGFFIPIFEKNGFITKLDMYVCEEVCRHQHEEKKRGNVTVPVSVNLSRINFYNNDLHKEILELLRKYELTSEDIKLEITESAYTDNPEDLVAAIDTLKRYGFKVLMDDFGSGYSSLNMLKDCCVDILKIDMKFMDDIENSKRASNIVYNIITLAKTLDMETLVEGVETEKQYEMLADMGCDDIQGYYFSKPISEEEFVERLMMEQMAES